MSQVQRCFYGFGQICIRLMRYLLDTNIYIYLTTDVELVSRDVQALLQEPDAEWCVSSETVRELIVAFNKGGIVSKYWKTAEEMVRDIEDKYFVTILPVAKEHMMTYSHLQLNVTQDHKDPSDHVIIAHAITEHIPLISSDRKFDFYRKQGLDFIFNEK